MQTVKELLDRIRWDPAFRTGSYAIGYEDHREPRMVHVPLERLVPGAGDSFSFGIVDEAGVSRTIPYHRVREVSRDGAVIWRRPEERAAGTDETATGRPPPPEKGAPS
jgi:uncharacterized protein (UPF0248 family)